MKKNKHVGHIKSVGRNFFPTWNKHVGHNKHVGRNIFITLIRDCSILFLLPKSNFRDYVSNL